MNTDANIEKYFSKFDTEENTWDTSESVTDTKEVEVKESKEVVSKETPKEESKTETSETASQEGKEEGREGKKEEQTPFHEHPRWQEKLKENKTLRESKKQWDTEKQEMMNRITKLENKTLSTEELEGMSPVEIQEHTRKQSEFEYNQKLETAQKSEKEAEEYIDQSLWDLKDAWHEFDENKLLKISVDYTDWDILKAFDLYQKFWVTKEEGAKEQVKEDAKKKAAESNTSNRTPSSKPKGFVSWSSWENVRNALT